MIESLEGFMSQMVGSSGWRNSMTMDNVPENLS